VKRVLIVLSALFSFGYLISATKGQGTCNLSFKRSTTPSGIYGETLVGGAYWTPLYSTSPVEACEFGVVGDAQYVGSGKNFTGVLVSGRADVMTPDTAGLVVGMHVAGPGIPDGATITSIVVNTSVGLSANATASGSANLTAWSSSVKGTDNTVALQAAIDYAIQNGFAEVRLREGRYKTTDTIHLGYGETFHTIRLVGSSRASFDGGLPGVTIYPTATDRPAINIQGARTGGIKGLTIIGQNHVFVQYAQWFSNNLSPNETDWLAPHLRRTGTDPGGLQKNSPYAGITIDAFSALAQSDAYPPVRYPAWTNITSQYNKNFSSDVTIDEVQVMGFAVAIVSQPNAQPNLPGQPPGDGNGDFIRIRGGGTQTSVYGIAISNSQSRNVEIRNLTFGGHHTFITGTRFGNGLGHFNGPLDNISGGGSFQVAHFNYLSYSGPLIFNHLYVENTVRIGRFVGSASFNSSVIFNGGILHLEDSNHGRIPAAFLELGIKQEVVFRGTQIVGNRRISNLAIGGGAPHVRFEGGIVASTRFALTQPPVNLPVTAAEQQAMNYTGGMLIGAPKFNTLQLDNSSFVGESMWTYFAPPTATFASQPMTETIGGSDARPRIPMTQAARRFIDIQQHLTWRMAVPAPALISMDRTDEVIANSLSYAGDMMSFTYAKAIFNHPQYNLAVGDLLYHFSTGTIFLVTDIGPPDPSGNVPIKTVQQNNIIVDALPGNNFKSNTNPHPELLGYTLIIRTGVTLPNQLAFGTFTKGTTDVVNVSRGDGYGADLAKYYANGDYVFALPFPAHGFLKWPMQSGTKLSGVTNGSPGSLQLSKPSLETGVFPIFPYPLY
jgi:hypothetical protein